MKHHKASRKQHKKNTSKRLIGCELEIACARTGSAIENVMRRWGGSIVEDSSINDGADEEGGFELNTAPASGDLFLEQIAELTRALRTGGAAVNTTCGYHVHVDASDFTWWDIRRLVLLYQHLEPVLFRCVPPSRRNNQYCVACGDKFANLLTKTTNAKNTLLDNMYGESLPLEPSKDKGLYIERLKREQRGPGRYSALNLHSWIFRGTIECRLAAGTIDYDKVVNWALLWAALLDWVKSHSDAEMNQLITKNALDALLVIAPTSEVRDWLDSRYFKFNGAHACVES